MKEWLDIDVNKQYIRKQFETMRISYKKVKHINVTANSTKNLVLR